jgi:ATP-binding cassette, subfamily B, bacterial HlyB/CyaB
MNTVSDKRNVEAVDQEKVPTPAGEVAIQIRLMAIAAAARFHGAGLHRGDLRVVADEIPSPAALTDWLRASGAWAKAVRLPWKQLIGLNLASPVVLLLNDGSAVLLIANDKKRDRIWIRHSRLAPSDPPIALHQ